MDIHNLWKKAVKNSLKSLFGEEFLPQIKARVVAAYEVEDKWYAEEIYDHLKGELILNLTGIKLFSYLWESKESFKEHVRKLAHHGAKHVQQYLMGALFPMIEKEQMEMMINWGMKKEEVLRWREMYVKTSIALEEAAHEAENLFRRKT